MIEYEYNFKVEDIDKVLKYCQEHGYELVSKTMQNRVVYENRHNRKIISRITTTVKGGKTERVIDFKNVNNNDGLVKQSMESLPMSLNNKSMEIVKSMLEVMDFEQSADNLRTRYVYEKGSVTFEIDDYTRPLMKVVAIEGEKAEVDRVYSELMKDKDFSKNVTK